jgi:hypothetical protein
MPVIPVNRVVDKKRIIGKNGGPRRRRGTRGPLTPKNCPRLLDKFPTKNKRSVSYE